MSLRFISLIILIFACLQVNSQTHEICGYKLETERISKKNPAYRKLMDSLQEVAMLEYAMMNSSKRRIIADTIFYEIPVVFHILYNTPAENVNQVYLISQLNEINLAFRKRNSDTSRIRNIFKHLSIDSRIQFVLAETDPDGNPSTGITRTQTSRTTFAANQSGAFTNFMKYSSMGGKDAWDPTKYLNIWICDMEFPGSPFIVYGFATPPTGTPNWENNSDVTKDSSDAETGVVLHYKIVGRNNPQSPVNSREGKTAIHEVGHYLGLRHVWGDGNFNNGCNFDDGFFDTPNARSSNALCNGQNSCTETNNDLPDQTENYMDYSLDGCAAMFSRQQIFMMRFVLNRFRRGLPYRMITYDTIYSGSVNLEVFPNPAYSREFLNIQLSTPVDEKCSLQIIDMNGKQVLEKNISSNIISSIDINALARSLHYIIILNSENRIIAKQAVVIY